MFSAVVIEVFVNYVCVVNTMIRWFEICDGELSCADISCPRDMFYKRLPPLLATPAPILEIQTPSPYMIYSIYWQTKTSIIDYRFPLRAVPAHDDATLRGSSKIWVIWVWLSPSIKPVDRIYHIRGWCLNF